MTAVRIEPTAHTIPVLELRKLGLERYKGYAGATEVQLAPLTILVGANNAGKTALARAIQLVAGGLTPVPEYTSEPLPPVSGGLRHGETFEDLVTGRASHGRLRVSATFAYGDRELSLSATVTNVVSGNGAAERQISDWSLGCEDRKVVLRRLGFERGAAYEIDVEGTKQPPRRIDWRGLLPFPPEDLAEWVPGQVGGLEFWASGVRHLQCPRDLLPSPFSTAEGPPAALGPTGRNAPLALAADDALRESVRDWYRRAFGVHIDIAAQGRYSDLVTREPARDAAVRLDQSGRGLSHVLPVVVTALTARRAGPGVDVIEHPEAELHPASHADIAELLLDNLAGSARPMVVETHSEMVLLRARRWIAEGRLPADDVLVYWVHTEPGRGSVVRKIGIDERGEMDGWPDGVFIEDYDEILAIRRAGRAKEQGGCA